MRNRTDLTLFDRVMLERGQIITGPSQYTQRLLNSVIVAGVSTVLSVALGVLAAYAFSRFNVPGKGDLLFFILSTRMLPAVVVTIPIFLMYQQLRLYDTHLGLILLYIYYMKIKFSASDEETGHGSDLEPLVLSPRSRHPTFPVIGLQGVLGLIGLVAGAHLFVTAAKSLSAELSVSPLLLALLIAPLATELPEMSNSFLWLYRKKDRLAVGNVTGAMVFQGTFPVSVGLVGTQWTLDTTALATMVLAVAAMTFSLLQRLWGGHWRPWLLSAASLLYVGYTVYLYSHGS